MQQKTRNTLFFLTFAWLYNDEYLFALLDFVHIQQSKPYTEQQIMPYVAKFPHLRVFILILSICAPFFIPSPSRQQLNRYYYYTQCDKHLRRGNYTQAIASINVLLSFLPSDDVGLYLRALAKYNLKDFRGAIEDLSSILDIKPFSFQPLILRAACYNEINQASASLGDIATAREIRPADRDLTFLSGITHFNLKEYRKAIEEFDITLQHAPNNPHAWINRGIAHLLTNDTAASIADFTQAARIDPYMESPRINLARVFYMNRNPTKARENLRAALAIAPNSPDALLIKALIEHDNGQLDSAINTLSHVINLSSRNSLALYNRAILRLQNNEKLLALQDYRNALEISPNNVILLYNISLLYMQLEQPQRALPYLERSTKLLPDFAKAHALKGQILLALGRNSLAKQSLDSATLLYSKYQQGQLDKWSDTSALFSRLLAFENDFAPNTSNVISAFEKVTELLPLANIQVGFVQPYQEWLPALRADSLCGAPFFSLGIPSDDSSRHLDISLFPPLNNAYAITLIEAISAANRNLYKKALHGLLSIPKESLIRPLANVVTANVLIDSLRYAPTNTLSTTNATGTPTPHLDTTYHAPIRLLEQEMKRNESPYLHYSVATAYYLQRNLHAADSQLSIAIQQNPSFAEALYNRGLIRLLQQRQNEACLDLSAAGQLGVDQAYKAIADHCNR